MAYNENINLFVTTDRNNADVFNAPLEKIIQNIQDTREYLYQLQSELDQLEFRIQSEYTPTEQLNDLLANGVKGDKGDTGEGLEYNWDGTALGVKLESESDFTYRDLKGEPGDVSTEQLEEALTDYPTLEYLGEVKTELENEIANIPIVDLTPYALKTQIPTTLPANGGNSDTVDGKHAADFVQATNAFIGTQDFNTYESTKIWTGLTKDTNAQNAPHQYSTVLNVGADNNSNFQLAHTYSNTSQFWVRGRHDLSGNYTPWAQVYTTENKPTYTASEVGAIPTSASCNKNWHWNGQSGQPAWVWGGEEPGIDMYVYNPLNWTVNKATYASDGSHIANEINNLKSTVVNGKTSVANAINGKLGTTLSNQTSFADMAYYINSISSDVIQKNYVLATTGSISQKIKIAVMVVKEASQSFTLEFASAMSGFMFRASHVGISYDSGDKFANTTTQLSKTVSNTTVIIIFDKPIAISSITCSSSCRGIFIY